ncbi:Uncharacterised protein [Vibrio cholerae]|uniref:Uncharacterized protein n=1 Tax=Vibrio cholerae TaxID=666 RepID=A0A655Z317_VIBCL|nr:Uncharacterised protein [Vibrio cholerae]
MRFTGQHLSFLFGTGQLIAQALHLSRGECDHFAPLAGRLIGTVRRLFSLMGRLRDFLIGRMQLIHGGSDGIHRLVLVIRFAGCTLRYLSQFIGRARHALGDWGNFLNNMSNFIGEQVKGLRDLCQFIFSRHG